MLTTDNVDELKKKGQGYLMGLVRRRREEVIGYIEAIQGAGRECKGGITQREQKIEGKYLIQTEEKGLSIEEAVKRYKELSEVERGFRSMKDVEAAINKCQALPCPP